jgi:hypothetical protein
VKRFQAMRDKPPVAEDTEAMPDPVAMFPEGRKPKDDFSDIRPSNPQGQSGQGWKVAFPSPTPATNAPTMPPNAEPIPGFRADSSLSKRMTDEYQKALAFNSSEQLVFTSDRIERDAEKGRSQSNGTASKSPTGGMGRVIVSAGQELTAVLNESLDSDYPSVAKATLTSPPELHGSTILISYALGQERVTAQVMKLILPSKEGERAREQTLAAVIKSGLPGLGGDVSHHWIPQIAAGVANAGLTAGALYYASQNQNKDLGTAVLVAPMIEQSVQGVMKPINYLGRDRPVTVKVPAGTEFKLLVTEGFEVDL